MVFYQHKNLHHPRHGADEFKRKKAIREFRDYSQYLKGNFVPTESKLNAMLGSGFSFPEDVKTLDKPMDVAKPEDFFKSDIEYYEGYEAASVHVDDVVRSIEKEPDHGLDIHYVDGAEVGELDIII